MSPYLYPLVIEFSLIAAAVLFKIYSNIGKLQRIDEGLRQDQERNQVSEHPDVSIITHAECHKSNTGVFIGFLVLVANFMVIIVYLESDDSSMKEWLYMIGDIIMQGIGLVTVLAAAFQIVKLDYRGHVENKIDTALLVVTISGLYFLLFSSAMPYMFEEEDTDYIWLWILDDASNFLQATIQMIFIRDGCQREAGTHAQWHHKPGRSFITFLLFCNISMWLINSFEMKEALIIKPMLTFYGPVPWTIILYLALPLAVFFRFHSVVCLSDIWVEAYPMKFNPRPENSLSMIMSGGDVSYQNAQLQEIQDRLREAEGSIQQRITQISNTNGDNTI